jgi:phosphonate transport system substrate-binding protein
MDAKPVTTRALQRRRLLRGAAAAALIGLSNRRAIAEAPFAFGLTPVFLTSDLSLLEALQGYLERAMKSQVRLVLRRTYQEISSELVAGQIDAAWICGYPFVSYAPRLSLVAVPVWRGSTHYQAYLLTSAERSAATIDDLAGDTHAFSDPNSNSGYLVTRALLAERKVRLDSHFARTFFTYGHRNVVRAVATGLAQSGSVDGYVWEVMTETEPALTRNTKAIWKSEWIGFPPIATSANFAASDRIRRFKLALRAMQDDDLGRRVLSLLRLDGFDEAQPDLFKSIADRVELVRQFD